MAHVTFTRHWDYKTPQLWIEFERDQTYHNVKRDWADAAISAGAAFEIDPPTRDQAKPPRTRKPKA